MLDQGLLFMDSDLAMLSTSQRWRGMTQNLCQATLVGDPHGSETTGFTSL